MHVHTLLLPLAALYCFFFCLPVFAKYVICPVAPLCMQKCVCVHLCVRIGRVKFTELILPHVPKLKVNQVQRGKSRSGACVYVFCVFSTVPLLIATWKLFIFCVYIPAVLLLGKSFGLD